MPACEGATPRARQLLARVQVDGPAALAFLISGGCCGGTSPVLVERSAVIDGFDVLLGDAAGVPVFAHPQHATYLSRDRFVIDALDGVRTDVFSLEVRHGGRFVLRELPAA
jgi:uncharacterized protein (DUF779 family)